MESIKLKRKLFDVVEEISLDIFLCRYKDKLYDVYKYDPKSIEGKDLIFSIKKINSSGVNSPRLFIVDKKSGFYALEHIDGIKCSDYLSKENMTDDLLESLFKNAFIAKVSGMTLNYEPEYWKIMDNKLYYTCPIFIRYQKEKDLAEKYIRLWFNTEELAKYLSNLGVFYDKSRIKAQYLTNKEIVLAVCKYYR